MVALKGRVQQHPQPPVAAASPNSNGSNGRNGGNSGSCSTEHHQHVLDLVVQEIRVLHKNRWVGGGMISIQLYAMGAQGLSIDAAGLSCSWDLQVDRQVDGHLVSKLKGPYKSSTPETAADVCHVCRWVCILHTNRWGAEDLVCCQCRQASHVLLRGMFPPRAVMLCAVTFTVGFCAGRVLCRAVLWLQGHIGAGYHCSTAPWTHGCQLCSRPGAAVTQQHFGRHGNNPG